MKDWDVFDSLTCDHPMLADINDRLLPPYPSSLPEDIRTGKRMLDNMEYGEALGEDRRLSK